MSLPNVLLSSTLVHLRLAWVLISSRRSDDDLYFIILVIGFVTVLIQHPINLFLLKCITPTQSSLLIKQFYLKFREYSYGTGLFILFILSLIVGGTPILENDFKYTIGH